MESAKLEFKKSWAADSRVVGIIAVQQSYPCSAFIDEFDLLLLIVFRDGAVECVSERRRLHHYIKGDCRVLEKRIDLKSLNRWIASGQNRNVVQWLLQGEIIYDEERVLEHLREELTGFGSLLQEQKLFTEFSLFLRKYLESKQHMHEGHTLDAYSNILEALHHWARIAVIEEGAHPETMVWKQVRQYNSGIYKLYEELTLSPETLEQRVKLVLLACEFSVMSKMKQCCTLLLKIIQSRPEPWSASELCSHPMLNHLHAETSLVLRKLAKRSLIQEVQAADLSDRSCLEIKYRSSS